MKFLKCLAITIIYGLSTQHLTFASPYSPITPSELDSDEQSRISGLKIQEGCEKPDLSNSDINGKASFSITFSEKVEPIDLKFLSSNGTDEDNEKIKTAIMKCKFSLPPQIVPDGSQKTFHYSWKPHVEPKGISKCFTIARDNYPSGALKRGEQGTTTLAYRYTGTANEYELKISHSSGYDDLDNAALKSAPLKCFQNGAVERNKEPNTWIEYNVNWQIADLVKPENKN